MINENSDKKWIKLLTICLPCIGIITALVYLTQWTTT